LAEATLLIAPRDAAWDAWVDRAPRDFHHGAAYHAFSERMGEGRAHLAVHGSAERFLAWPYLVVPIPGAEGRSDASSVYGCAGPVGLGLEDLEFRARAWRALRGIWAEQGLVALFTRFHPLLENQRWCEGLAGEVPTPGGELLRLGRSVSIELRPGAERRAAYPKVLRQELRGAEAAGLVVELDRERRHFDAFVELYRATMAKNRAESRYLFSRAYLDGLVAALGPAAHVAVARRGSEVAAALLFTVHGELAQAHLTGASARFRSLSPLKLLIDGTAEIARGLGARALHLGAGRGGREDTLFDFKRRFASRLSDFVIGRWVLDARAYGELARAAGVDGGTGFFPAYRAPRPAAQGAR
jgi:hypothetical protein